MRIYHLTFPIVLAVVLVACSTASADQPAANTSTLAVSCDDFAATSLTGPAHIERSVAADVGTTLTISVCSNPSTGYGWAAPAIADTTVVSLADRSTVEPATDLVGAAGHEDFVLAVERAGTTTIDLSYGQPWEGGEKGAWTLTVTVTAR